MSEWTRTWDVLWNRAAQDARPFEIDEVAPEVAQRLGLDLPAAVREVGFLLEELWRLPEGRRYFRREGNAVVPLPELIAAQGQGRLARDVYPFEV
jgi:hypothetical protein